MNIACQNRLRLPGWEEGRYRVQIVTFGRLRKAPKIKGIETIRTPGAGLKSYRNPPGILGPDRKGGRKWNRGI